MTQYFISENVKDSELPIILIDEYREGAATAGNDFRPPVSSQQVLVLNANYISRFLTYLTPPKT